MRSVSFLSYLAPLFVSLSHAAPVARRATSITDAQILQFALTLEHLENTFYTQALSQFSNQSFVDAGLPPDSFGRFQQISQHEATHVKFLTQTLQSMGETAPEACNYSFPYNDPVSFAQLSQTFEGVGTSAYLGAANLLQNKTLVTASGAILTTEARQNAWVNSYALGSYPWSGPYDTPLSASLAFSLAKPFIISCPSTNPSLPVTDLPALTIANNATQNLTGGSEITLSFSPNATQVGSSASDWNASNNGNVNGTSPSPSPSSSLFLALKRGLDTTFVELQSGAGSSSGSAVSFTVTLPSLQGTVYAFVTNSNSTQGVNIPDTEVVTGAQVLSFVLPADVDNSN